MHRERTSLFAKVSPPQGVIRLELIEAQNLMKKDIGVLGMGKSDPYCIIRLGAQKFQTKTINNTVNPRWNFVCEVGSWFSFLDSFPNAGLAHGST